MSTTTRRSTSPGCSSARAIATLPPIECPTTFSGSPSAGGQDVGDRDRPSPVRDRLRPAGLTVVRQVHHDHPSRSASDLGDRGPVLALAEQTVQQQDPRPGVARSVQCRSSRSTTTRGFIDVSSAPVPAAGVPVPPLGHRGVDGPGLGSAGQTTTCGVAGGMGCEQPGQRYSLVAAAPGDAADDPATVASVFGAGVPGAQRPGRSQVLAGTSSHPRSLTERRRRCVAATGRLTGCVC